MAEINISTHNVLIARDGEIPWLAKTDERNRERRMQGPRVSRTRRS